MAALRASEAHHRRLVNMLPDAVCRIHPEGRLLAVNPRAVAMLGYASPGELLEKSTFDLALVEEHERIKADIAATLQAGGGTDVITTGRPAKDVSPCHNQMVGPTGFEPVTKRL